MLGIGMANRSIESDFIKTKFDPQVSVRFEFGFRYLNYKLKLNPLNFFGFWFGFGFSSDI